MMPIGVRNENGGRGMDWRWARGRWGTNGGSGAEGLCNAQWTATEGHVQQQQAGGLVGGGGFEPPNSGKGGREGARGGEVSGKGAAMTQPIQQGWRSHRGVPGLITIKKRSLAQSFKGVKGRLRRMFQKRLQQRLPTVGKVVSAVGDHEERLEYN